VENQRNIYLVGLMGAGKTTVGRQLARRLGGSSSTPITKSSLGPAWRFRPSSRSREDRISPSRSADDCRTDRPEGIVMATGGGVVIDPENRRRLHDSGWVVYLNVPPVMLYERTRHDRNRPLLQVPDPLARLEVLHAERDPLYREIAHFVVEGLAPGGQRYCALVVERIQSDG
jgi:shikimate kinase